MCEIEGGWSWVDVREIYFDWQKDAAEKKYDVSIEELMHDERQADRKAKEQEDRNLQQQLHMVSSSVCAQVTVKIEE